MKKVLILIFLSLVVVLNMHAQNNKEFHVSGTIKDSTTLLGLEYATIKLTGENSNDIFGTITSKNGSFDVLANSGNYILTINYISCEEKVFSNFKLDKDLSLGTILLTAKTESLDEVDISGASKSTSIKLGKIEYYVEKDISSEGGTVIDVLSNIPLITLGPNGEPLIRNVEVTVLINGRISAMTKPNMLKNLQASSIKKVEVITSPSARYSGNTTGGIINIILKKGLDNGLNGSITTTAGIKDIYGASTSINFRKDKLNIYTSTSYFHRNPIATTIIDNEYTENNITTGYLNEDRKYSRKNNVLNTSFGMDYFINDYISLNLEGSFSKFNGDFTNSNISSFSDANGNLINSTQQLILTDHDDDIFEISTTYDQYFETEGQRLYFSFLHSNDEESNNSLLKMSDLFPKIENLPLQTEHIYDDLALQNTYWYLAYIFPTTETSTLEFGYEANLGKVENNYLNEIISNGDFVTNPNTSNILHYSENWHGVYTEFKKENEKYNYTLALRAERTNLEANLLTTSEVNSKKYTDIFPSVQFHFTKNETQSISFAYRRGIFRATYPDLNPFELRISETTSFKGNPDLLPFYENALELSFLNTENAKFTFNPTFYFKKYNDVWQYITVETGEIINGVPKLITTPINLGSLSFTGLEVLINYSPKEWLEFNSNIDLKYVKQSGIYEYKDVNDKLIILDYNETGFAGTAKLNTMIDLPFNMAFQSLIQYNLNSKGAYSERYAYTYINASINKDFLDEKITLTLSANDIFDSNKTKRLRWTDNINSMSNFQWREPSVLLSLTYRFNQSEKEGNININKNDDEEKY